MAEFKDPIDPNSAFLRDCARYRPFATWRFACRGTSTPSHRQTGLNCLVDPPRKLRFMLAPSGGCD
ncbi:MAG: hypothetical protein ABJC66_12530 [Gammaproteobacteria bacterium]